MANIFERKQHHRQKELNSRRGSHLFDEHRPESRQDKRIKLLLDSNGGNGLYPVRSSLSYIERQPSTHATPADNNDDMMDVDHLVGLQPDNQPVTRPRFSNTVEIEPTDSDVCLAHWIRTNEGVKVTPINERYENYAAMINKCRPAIPHADVTLLNDLKRAFGYPPTIVLSKIMAASFNLPFWIRNESGQLVEQARIFQSINRLNEEGIEYVSRINRLITFRTSYGVLLRQGDKFFAKTVSNKKGRRSAIKGYPILKPDGQLEHPWETAQRMAAHNIRYWNDKQKEWEIFNLKEHTKENERREYLECLVDGDKQAQDLRYIGLFVIHLEPTIRIGVYGSEQIEGHGNWYSIEQSMNDPSFHTIGPFLKYLYEQDNLH